eukprot:COSAG05_NODE_5929_length_1056_cov_3.880878_1_plen_332_part_01
MPISARYGTALRERVFKLRESERMQKTMSSSSPFILQGGDKNSDEEYADGGGGQHSTPLAPTVSKPTMSEQLQMQKTMSTSSPFVLQANNTSDAGYGGQPGGLLATVSIPRALQAAGMDKNTQLRMQKTMSSSSPFILQGGDKNSDEDNAGGGGGQHSTPLAPTVSKPTMSEQLQMQKTMSNRSPFMLAQDDDSDADDVDGSIMQERLEAQEARRLSQSGRQSPLAPTVSVTFSEGAPAVTPLASSPGSSSTCTSPGLAPAMAWAAQLEAAHSELTRSSSAHERAIGAKIQQRTIQKTMSRDDTPQAPWQGPGPTVSNPVALHAAGLDKAQQ